MCLEAMWGIDGKFRRKTASSFQLLVDGDDGGDASGAGAAGWLVLEVTDGDTHYVQCCADVRYPICHLDQSDFKLGATFVGVPEQRAVELINVSDRPAAFNWSPLFGKHADYTIRFKG